MDTQKTVNNITFGKSDIQSVRFLTKWINKDFDFGIKRLEDLCTGAAYCQIMHKCFPKAIPLKCVNFMADNRRDYEMNLTLLRKCFHRLNIPKNVPEVLQVARGHLEFASWMFKFHQFNNNSVDTYDAKKERELANPTAVAKRFFPKVARCNTILGITPKLNVPKEAVVLRSHSLLATVLPTLDVEYRPTKQLENPKIYYEECRFIPLPGSESDSEHIPENGSELTGKKPNIQSDRMQMLKALISKEDDFATRTLHMINDVSLDGLREQTENTDENAQLAKITEKFESIQKLALKHSDFLIKTMLTIRNKAFESSVPDFQDINTL